MSTCQVKRGAVQGRLGLVMKGYFVLCARGGGGRETGGRGYVVQDCDGAIPTAKSVVTPESVLFIKRGNV